MNVNPALAAPRPADGAAPWAVGAAPGPWVQAARLARRELRGGIGNLRLLFVCLFLGVFALAGVGSLASAILTGLAREGQVILGGDVEVRLTQRLPSEAERAAIEAEGIVSDSVKMRAMLRGLSGEAEGRQLLGELKAVDSRWPLYGEARLADGGGNAAVQSALARGAVIGEAFAEQLGLRVGDRIGLGEAEFRVSGILAAEPDKAGEGFAFGPTILIGLDRLEATRLMQPGSLYRAHVRLRLPAGADPAAVTERLDTAFPDAGWRLADRRDGAPGIRRFVERLAQFLSLVSLTALAVAGIGVADGVRSWLDRKTGTIASLKTLGASSGLIVRTYFLIILAVGLAAAGLGALLGAAVPWAVVQLAGDAMPVPPALGLYPLPLVAAIAFGLLVALAFAVAPLARAGALPAQRLLRGSAEPWPWPSRSATLVAGGAGLLVAALAIWQAPEPIFAAGFVAAAVLIFLLLAGLGWLVRRAAAAAPRPRRALLRLALANLHRPGAMTGQLVVALGLGLSLFATLAIVETSFNAELRKTVPDRAPTFFVVDIPREDGERFRAFLPEGSEVAMVPSLRGPITSIRGTAVADLGPVPEGAWILRGDRGLTWSATLPAGNRLVAGKWWPEDYAGPPLVSMDAEQAGLLGLKVGDTIGVSVLGVEVAATIASLREIRWDSLGFNFVLVFDPATLGQAPYTWMATVSPPAADEASFTRAVSEAFPTASVVRVRDVVGQVGALLRQVGVAVRAAASVAILAGLAVLVGAIAAQARSRIYEGAIIKTLGATRRQLMISAGLEYALVGGLVAAIALGIGAFLSWIVLTRVLELSFQPDWGVVLLTVVAGAAVTLMLGLAGAARALGVRVSETLRTL
ncbi:MAG: FtsX-like permease family protein [Sphingomonadaceae bacterium]